MATKVHTYSESASDTAHLHFQQLAEQAATSFGTFRKEAQSATHALLRPSPAQGDWIMGLLLPIQWMAGAVTLYRTSSTLTVGMANDWFVAGLLMLFSVFLILGFAGRSITRYVAALTQVALAMLLPSVFGQGAESALPYFLVALALVAIYRDYRLLCVAGGLVLLGSFYHDWSHLAAGQEMRAYRETFLILAETLALAFIVRRPKAESSHFAPAPAHSR
jgi:hypothetical protein